MSQLNNTKEENGYYKNIEGRFAVFLYMSLLNTSEKKKKMMANFCLLSTEFGNAGLTWKNLNLFSLVCRDLADLLHNMDLPVMAKNILINGSLILPPDQISGQNQ